MKKIMLRDVDPQNPLLKSDLPDILKRVYAARHVTDQAELSYELSDLLPFDTLMGIEQAIAVLTQALQEQQRFLIVGDFDADGATSTALAVSALHSFGAQHVDYLVPNRFEYGYGLTPEIVNVAAAQKPDVIITVDNGIASCAGVDAANTLGIKVVITDHHLPGDTLPEAAAIVDPNQTGDEFPSKCLAGVGVIFYVMLALRRELITRNWFSEQAIPQPNMGDLLDLVALGTVADVVPLDHNNRILVHQGLKRIRSDKCRPGLRALLQVANREPFRLVAADLGFAIGPRLNAAGRLDDMSLGIACLLADEAQALSMAKQLDDLNQERRAIEEEMKQQAYQAIQQLHLDKDTLPHGLCLYDPSWHQGVVGIVAGRVKDRFYRPVIAFAKVSETELKGSARSISGLHIRDTLDAVAKKHPTLIEKFGGHAMAAGLSLALEHLEPFTAAFNEEIKRVLSDDQLEATLNVDGEVASDDMTLATAELLRDAGPWGQHFPEPLFTGHFELLEQRLVGGKHLKVLLGLQDVLETIDAIAFNVDPEQWPNYRLNSIDLVYRLDVNEYRGRRRLQLIIEELLPTAKV